MTYGIPYTVRGWGDEIVTTVAIRREDQLRDFTAVVRGTESGPVILVPTVALTPVDTTPPEPEPGVYFIGDDGEAWQRFEDRDDEQRWCGVGYEPLCTWAEVWAHTAGRPQRVPDTTIRRLVPEPAPVDVELPWERKSGRRILAVRVDDDPDAIASLFLEIGDPDDGCMDIWLPSDLAEAAAAALLAAARAAREATP